MTRKGLRLLSYGRVSDVRGREGPSFISPTVQAERNRAYAAAYGHTIVAEEMELDRSGNDKNRPIFNKFMAEILNGRADGIIVAKLDRFARSNVLAHSAIEQIEDAGAVLISVAEQIDTSGYAGRFMRSIFLATAEMERERIGEQWAVAKAKAVANGVHVAKYIPPGYKRRPDRRLELDERHAPAIRRAFEMAAEGVSPSRIAAHLTEAGVPYRVRADTKKARETPEPPGTIWLGGRIGRVLANRVYLGEARSSKGDVKAGAHPALIDERTFELAQRKPRTFVASETVSMLSGLVRCAGCSFAMKSQQGNGKTVPVYRCAPTTIHGRCPQPSTISKARLEEYVIAQFLEHVADVAVEPIAADDADAVEAAARAERDYRQTLKNIELRRDIGEADHDELVTELRRDWQSKQAAIPERRPSGLPDAVHLSEHVERLHARGDAQGLRELLGSAIQAVFVRPAASRARDLPVADRVKVVFVGEERLELPRRGERFEPRAYKW